MALITELDKNGVLSRALFEQLSEYEQEETLKSIICRIGYEYKESYIEVSLKNGVQFGFRAAVKPHPGGIPKKERQAYKEIQHLKADKATYYKALALQIREYMRVNNLSQKECAAALGMSPARVSQLVRIDKI